MPASLAAGAAAPVFDEPVGIGSLDLACGGTIHDAVQHVTVYGRATSSRTVLVCHALTGSSRAAEWWPGIVGDGALFDPRDWRIVCVNALGSCYGSTQTPLRVTVEDMVRAQTRALDVLGIGSPVTTIGGSLGGMQALAWAVDRPERVTHAIVVGAGDHTSPMTIAHNSIQREALSLDHAQGLRLARKIAMLTYKSEELFNHRHARRADRSGAQRYDVEGYLERQADEFEHRMDPGAYATLTHAMDSFDVRDASPPPGNAPHLTFVGISSDRLFRAGDVRDAACRFATRGYDAVYLEFESDHGHDAFLADGSGLAAVLDPFVGF